MAGGRVIGRGEESELSETLHDRIALMDRERQLKSSDDEAGYSDRPQATWISSTAA